MAEETLSPLDQLALAPTAPSPLPRILNYEVRDFFAPHIHMIAGFSPVDNGPVLLENAIASFPDMGRVHAAKRSLILGLSPATWLILSENDEVSKMLDQLDPTAWAITDLSGGRVVFEVTGPDAAIKLGKGTLLDFTVDSFPVDTVKQTTIHHISVMIARTDEATFLVSSMRSFSDDLKSWLKQQ